MSDGRSKATPRRSPATPSGHLHADPRLPAWLAAGFGALVVAIATGQPALAAIGAPFLALAAFGILGREPVEVRGRVVLAQTQVLEGDIIEGEATIDWDGEAELDVVLAGLRGVSPIEPQRVGWSLPACRGPVRLPFRVRARAWGVHEIGVLWVRARRPGGLLAREQAVASMPALRVLPTPSRLDRLLKPAQPRAVAGMHLSRFRSHGTDFAELRPYQAGDRLRDLSWATSARLGTPWIAVRHPERTGTLVLVIDAFFTREAEGTEALARTARAAWALASVHLRAQDRVGLLVRGGTTVWLPPRGGRRARWALLDELLSVGGAAEDPWRTERRGIRTAIPADAIVAGVTGLGWPTFVRDLLHHRRAGRTTVALVIDTTDLLPQSSDAVDVAARRLLLAERDAERDKLDRAGIPTALVTAEGGIAPAISTLRRRMIALQANRPGAKAR